MALPQQCPPSAVRIVLADDHQLVRSALKALLTMLPQVTVAAEAGNGRELVTLVDALTPDLVLTDVSMPLMDGISAVAHIRGRHPQMKILVISMHDDLEHVRCAVSSGACGYVVKNAPSFELEQAIRSVMHTGSYFSPAIARQLLQPPAPQPDAELTLRQQEILRLIASGRSAKEIAYELGLSHKTVAVHRARLMIRLGISDIPGLTRYAVRKGLVRV